jgi:sulfate adenylyltransferase subunit 1
MTIAPAASLLRFATAGSVDDGKSTLVGRLLHDSRNRGHSTVDLALLTDGLRAEREQGITITVARNMVTGASTVELAVVVVDARNGVVEQTRRHAAVAALLRVPHLVLAVNKMDFGGYTERVFAATAEEFSNLRCLARHRRPHRRSRLGTGRGQRGGALGAHGLVQRADPAGAPGDRPGGQ